MDVKFKNVGGKEQMLLRWAEKHPNYSIKYELLFDAD